MSFVLKCLLQTVLFLAVVLTIASALMKPDGPTKNAVGPDPQKSCIARGIAYFKEVGSWPKLHTTGEWADHVVLRRCARSTRAF